MDRRTNEGPMEFAWSNGAGPVDENSPFTSWQRSRSLNSSNSFNHVGKPGPRSAFESPQKQSFAQSSSSSFPALRAPAGQKYFIDTQPQTPGRSKPLPPPPSHLFNTPRKFDIEFSSDCDTPESVDRNNAADSDLTPESRSMVFQARGASKPSTPSKEDETQKGKKRRESLFVRLWNSPSRLKALDGYSTKAEHRVKKRRAKARVARATDSENEDSRKGSRRGGRSKRGKASDDHGSVDWTDPSDVKGNAIAALFKFIDAHPSLPLTLTWWVQVGLNVFVLLVFVYMVFTFMSTIRADVDKMTEMEIALMTSKVIECEENFQTYNCIRKLEGTRKICDEFDICRQQNPHLIGRAQVSAKTFSIIINTFVEHLTLRTIAFTIIAVALLFAVVNTPFFIIRNRMHHNGYAPPPPTPQRHPSAGAMGYHHDYLPYGGSHQGATYYQNLPALGGADPEPSALQLPDIGSPAKRRHVEGR